jgi:D-alanine transaminase
LVREEEVREGLLYVQLTGGAAPRSHVVGSSCRPTYIAYLRPHRYPRAADVEQGISAVTVADERWGHCDLKTTMLLPAVLARRRAAERGADEALLVGADGHIREGASTNLFVASAGQLLQPPDSRHMLPGTVRAVAVRLAAECGIEVQTGPVDVDLLVRSDEAFTTSTSQLVMPLVEVDDRPIGGGSAGPIAVELARRLRAEFELEEPGS